MCSYSNNPEDCPMYACSNFSKECLNCKWLKKQKRIARISQIALFVSIVIYIVLTANMW